MQRAFTNNIRLFALSGLAAIAFGVLVLIWPGLTWVALLALFGATAFVIGGFSLAAGLNLLAEHQTDWVPYILEGAASIAVGAVTFLWPGWTALTIVYLIAFWAVATGIFEVIIGLEFGGKFKGEWMLAVSGLLSMAFGTLVAIYPRSGALAIVWIIGLYAILDGLTRLYASYRLGRIEKHVASVLQPSTKQQPAAGQS